ncbi:hypothetical protein IAT38_003216 [Cryptococcus sp. DSM 104549]
MFARYLLALLPLLAVASAMPSKRAACPAFALQDYADFQISGGVGGNAQAEANAVFVDPFNGCDLSTVDATSLKNIQTMREAAESAETDQFNGAIDAASGDELAALKVGKSKNKVLKLTGEIQALQIKAAQGSDETSSIAAEQTKLDTNVAADKKNAGATSQPVAGSAKAAAVAAVGSSSSASSSASSSSCTCA